jgi:radical SAM superfamily enzyme YgiQ (UPF0313 family)
MLTAAHPTKNVGLSFAEKRFPIGVGSIIQILRENKVEVTFLDRYLLGKVDFNPKDYDMVGLYTATPCYEDIMYIVNKVKDAGVKLVVGGPHASIMPDSMERADHIVVGEGEEAIRDIITGNAPHIIRKERIKDLDSLPFPPYDIFSKMSYMTTVNWFSDSPTYNYVSSRGCPMACQFCSDRDVWGRLYTYMSAERIVNDIKRMQAEFGVKGVYFREDNFTLNNKRVFAFCDLILKEGISVKWMCETRVDSVPEALIKVMAQAGCKAFYVGFESGSQRMLDVYNKGTSVGQGEELAVNCKKYGISVAGSFLYGHPEETDTDRRLTDFYVNKLGLHTVWKNQWREPFGSDWLKNRGLCG